MGQAGEFSIEELRGEDEAGRQSFNATADADESVTFTCITSGSPDPEVTWHRKGQQIEASEQHVLSSLEGGRSMLTVRNVGQGDGGPYTCRATNKAGVLESELTLKVFVILLQPKGMLILLYLPASRGA
ncbi:hypothetical protein ACEWY4_001961 [Coilia grayii]|uniref:Ig-like domain-containing protein n=1 Tax=Coilia grayii TaxID=363190 RepID=A0ABD1KUE6_9TELE